MSHHLIYSFFCNKNSSSYSLLLETFYSLIYSLGYPKTLLVTTSQSPLLSFSLLPNLLLLVYFKTQSLICLSSLPTHFVHGLFQSPSFKYHLLDKGSQIKISSLHFSPKFQT